MSESYVTIATDDISCLGCLVLCNSLKQTGTEKLISVLVNPIVSFHLKSVLQKSFDRVFCLNDLHAISDEQSQFDINGEYQRLKCWLLIEFSKCVFLESDVLVVENIDDLFDRMELSAISDPRWPDCFDAGVFVFQPNLKTYKNLIDYSLNNHITGNSFQGLLNMFFCAWNSFSIERKIPFIYNCQMNTTFYTQSTALVQFGHSIKAARLGNSVFHLMQPDPSLGGLNHENWSRLWSQWWKIFNETVKPAVDNNDKLNFKRTGVDYSPRSTPCDPESQVIRDSPVQSYPKQEWTQPNYSSAGAVQESSCPSQDFVVACESTTVPSDSINQINSKEEQSKTIEILVDCPSETDEPVTDSNDDKVKDLETSDKAAPALDCEKDHQMRWERGEIDYMGEDRFANILAQLTSTLVSSSSEEQFPVVEE